MTVTTENIELGSCDVKYNSIDLGATKGGVKVKVATEKYTVKSDQTGETPLKDIITGTAITITVPMLETDLTKLNLMMPQSVSTAGGAAPTGRTVSGNQNVGESVISLSGSGGGSILVGQTLSFADHRTVYKVVAVSGSDVTIRTLGGTLGLEADITATEVVTFQSSVGGVEIRTGVNVDLFDFAYELHLRPTGASDAKNDFTVYKAAPAANFEFAYELANEKVYEVEFTAYPDTSNNNRLAAFGNSA